VSSSNATLRGTTSPARCYFTISGTVVECSVEAEVPVVVMVYVVEPGPPLPPHAD